MNKLSHREVKQVAKDETAGKCRVSFESGKAAPKSTFSPTISPAYPFEKGNWRGGREEERKKERLTLYILVNTTVRGTSSMENRQPSL